MTQPATTAPGSILLVTPWYSGSQGGVAISTETMAAALAGLGTRVVAIVLNNQVRHLGRFGEEIFPLTVYGKEVLARGWRGWLGYARRFLEAGWLVTRLVRRYRIRTAHFNFCVASYAPIRFWLRLWRIPIVLTFRGSDINRLPSDSAAEDEARQLIDAAAVVTAVSSRLLGKVRRRFPAASAKSVVVNNPVPIDVWSTHKSTTPTARDIDVLFLGNLIEIKGPDILLAAFRLLLVEHPEATLCYVGSGSLEAGLRARVHEAGLDSQVSFAGQVPRRNVSSWLRRTRLLALPSRAEGFPLAAIEAQLLGVPVVGCDVGGVSEAVLHERTGLLVAAGDAVAMASALLRLLRDDAEWEGFSLRASEWAERCFSPEAMAHRYATLYGQASAGGEPNTRSSSANAASGSYAR